MFMKTMPTNRSAFALDRFIAGRLWALCSRYVAAPHQLCQSSGQWGYADIFSLDASHAQLLD